MVWACPTLTNKYAS